MRIALTPEVHHGFCPSSVVLSSSTPPPSPPSSPSPCLLACPTFPVFLPSWIGSGPPSGPVFQEGLRLKKRLPSPRRTPPSRGSVLLRALGQNSPPPPPPPLLPLLLFLLSLSPPLPPPPLLPALESARGGFASSPPLPLHRGCVGVVSWWFFWGAFFFWSEDFVSLASPLL